MISDFLRQSNDLRAEFRTRLLSLGLMQCKSYIILCGKHVVYMRLPSHKKGSPAQAILGPLRLTLVHYELLAKQSLSIGDCLFLPTQLPKTDGATATIRYNPPLHHHMGPHRESTQEHKSKRLRPSKEVRQFFPEDRMLPSTPASTLLQLLHSILMEFAQSDYI